MAETALFPPGERDRLALRLQNAVGGFVDGPRDAVEDADRVLEDTIQHLTAALAERRRTIRTSWQPTPPRAETTPTTSVPPTSAPHASVPPTSVPPTETAPEATLTPDPSLTPKDPTGPTGTPEKPGAPGAPGAPGTPAGDTEQLRLALRDYREATEHLLKI
ncbi:hypothetical protein [Streptomyces sp. NPDC087300]|uniref:hypothetical protein n=1 Tax=Streptomyces sp. NPDC087300 TaxID=3365780 RepID=UPI00383082CD